MSEQQKEEIFLNLKKEIEIISDQLCFAVNSEFDFLIELSTSQESIQKLCMLINFVLDSARRALTDIKEKNVQLTELDQLKSDFMANISHKLRTPLTLILAPLETILKDMPSSLSQKQQENLLRMHRNAARLYTLVNNLLDFSKAEAGKFSLHEELLNVNELVSQLVEDAQDLASSRKIALRFLPCKDYGLLWFDPSVLEKILLNLISNALKFTPEGGHVDISLEKKKNILELSVADSGLGIPASQIPHLFQRFHQIDSKLTRMHEGTGIGLALINQFVCLMNGKIDVQSEEGKGTKFIITLPICQLSKENKENTNKQEQSFSKPLRLSLSPQVKAEEKSKNLIKTENHKVHKHLSRVLIVDDNPDMRSYITSLLKNTYDVLAVENGKLALEAIPIYHPNVILSDVMMPIMDGYQLTQTIKSDPQYKHIPIILITAKAGKEAIVSGIDIGADDYLPKPFSPDELMARTHSSLRIYQSYMMLSEVNDKLREEIEERKKLEVLNDSLNSKLIFAARRAGMADIATSVLHNIGNVLNSVGTSVSIISEETTQSKLDNLIKISEKIEQHKNTIASFFTEDPQGQRIPNYFNTLSHVWLKYKGSLLEEVNALDKNLQHIRDIISSQQSLSASIGIREEVVVSDVIEEALALNKIVYEQKQIDIIREYAPVKKITTDRVKLLQVIVNFIKNSIESLKEANNDKKWISLHIQEKDDSYLIIQVGDNGLGILPENIKKIFSYGFTTKKEGHGFGLHTSALSAQEMGGNLLVESKGAGKGATFTLTLPYKPPNKKGKEYVQYGTEANTTH